MICPITEMELVEVPGGSFEMGDSWGDGLNDQKPVHKVTISSFVLGKYPVTQKQWVLVMGDNPSLYTGTNHPIERVSWEDCQKFLVKLNQLSGCNYRLPTEAEWEYACRSGGEQNQWSGCNSETELVHYAWYNKNSGERTHPVGQKRPNGLGLYDMSGNVYEWCQDWYGEDYYGQSAAVNPAGPAEGHFRVIRGGDWYFNAWATRSATRSHLAPCFGRSSNGFRLAHSAY